MTDKITDIIRQTVSGHMKDKSADRDDLLAKKVWLDLHDAGFVIVPRKASDAMSDMGDDMADAGASISGIWEAMIDVALEEQAK